MFHMDEDNKDNSSTPELVLPTYKKKRPQITLTPQNTPQTNDDTFGYTYQQMLQRLYSKIGSDTITSQCIIPVPKIIRSGKRTVIQNFNDILCIINPITENNERTRDHLIKYISIELSAHVDNTNNINDINIHGRFQVNQIEKILREYIKEYVRCRTCRSFDTKLIKDQRVKNFILKCFACSSSWTTERMKKLN